MGSNIKISSNFKGSQIVFTPNKIIRDISGFKPKIIYEEYNLSDHPVDNLAFDIIFLETNIAHGVIFKGKRSGILLNFTIDVNPGYKYVANIRGGFQWYRMESKDFLSSISFNLKIENGKLVSFKDQSITFRLLIGEVWFLFNKWRRL